MSARVQNLTAKIAAADKQVRCHHEIYGLVYTRY